MPTLIVAGTSPGAGKTALTAAIASHFSTSSQDESGVTVAPAWANPDGSTVSDLRDVLGDIAAARSLGSGSDSAATVAGKAKELAGPGRITILEGKTGNHEDNLALADEIDGLVLLVAQPADDILDVARPYGARLAGVIVNFVPRYRVHDLESQIIPQLEAANIRLLGWIPEDRRLLAPTVGLVAEHLSAEIILKEEESNRLIDNFLIGGMVLDWGPFYFGSKENVGVVVRGDRPDIQLAALQTDTVRAMVLTKGARPVEYVIYEATQRDVPLVMTSGSTEETTVRLESLQAKVRFDHPDKLMFISEHAAQRLDLDALDVALSQQVTR
jgi:BioD-like phosphotransacetylase family protein